VSLSDLAALLRASTVSVLLITALDHFMVETNHIPRVTLLLDWSLTIMVLGGMRAAIRLAREEVRPAALRQRLP